MSYDLSGLLPGDNGITMTLNRMVGSVRASVHDYRLRQKAERVIASCRERDEQCEVGQIFRWVLAHFRYVRDPRFLEMYKAPDAAIGEINMFGELAGDCDDVSVLLAALLTSIGYKTKFVVIAIPGQGDEYRHVYPMVFMPKRGTWVALEATARYQPMGFEAPQGSRRREFAV